VLIIRHARFYENYLNSLFIKILTIK
jgi:hypothetical protein